MLAFMIIGHGGHGKDTFAKLLSKATGLNNAGSCSQIALELVAREMNEPDLQKCWNERHDKRDEWRRICDSKRDELGYDYLVKALASKGDIGNGIRARREFEGAYHLFEFVIYISNPHEPFDPTFELHESDADIVIYNTGTVRDLEAKAFRFARSLRQVMINEIILKGTYG